MRLCNRFFSWLWLASLLCSCNLMAMERQERVLTPLEKAQHDVCMAIKDGRYDDACQVAYDFLIHVDSTIRLLPYVAKPLSWKLKICDSIPDLHFSTKDDFWGQFFAKDLHPPLPPVVELALLLTWGACLLEQEVGNGVILYNKRGDDWMCVRNQLRQSDRYRNLCFAAFKRPTPPPPSAINGDDDWCCNWLRGLFGWGNSKDGKLKKM